MKHLSFLLTLMLCWSATAADWPVWRGENADGISTEKGWNPKALADGAKVLWQTELGRGYAAVAVRRGHVFAIGNNGTQDVVRCLDAKSGREIWTFAYDCAAGGGYKGPRASPVLNGPAVFTVSQDGQLHCLTASTGKVIWKKNITDTFGAQPPKWRHAASPLVLGDLLILNAGEKGLALKKQTGDKVWGGTSGVCGYASPVPFKMGNQTCVAIFSKDQLVAREATTGKVLWDFPWQTRFDVNAADPVILPDNRMFISSGYKRGCALLDYSSGKPKKLWENNHMSNHFSSSLFMNGYLFGVDGNAGRGGLKCLDPKTGNVAWEQDTGFGSLLGADGKIIMLNDAGKLMIAEAVPAGYKELSSAQNPLTKTCWTMPVLANGLLYCRNDKGTLICVDLR